jgi:5-formyltetrahydrofolate cyclo-ligase
VAVVAYDRHGNRMGYGGGYYDRYLKNIGEHTVLIGINFSAQVVDELPARPHDMPVDIVIHENGIIHIPKQKPCP